MAQPHGAQCSFSYNLYTDDTTLKFNNVANIQQPFKRLTREDNRSNLNLDLSFHKDLDIVDTGYFTTNNNNNNYHNPHNLHQPHQHHQHYQHYQQHQLHRLHHLHQHYPENNNIRNKISNNHSCKNLCAYPMSVSELEAEAALASGFLGLQGPLVGLKKSSHAITEEYAKADPVYVQKTAVLPQTYSHYRPILGDGNCGWRAVGFAYFETLLRLQSKARLEEEIARMNSLNNLLITSGGFEQWLFEDMVLSTTGLLRDLADQVEVNPQKAECILMERFNDNDVSNAIIYHFRLLASSWLKANPAIYEGFITDKNGVDAYSKNYIEPVNVEIEHLIMCLLIDVLLKPIGIAVEIVYLDRTPGPHANTHVFRQEEAVGQPINPGDPVIYLLFRPSHYDILYQDQLAEMPPSVVFPASTDLLANRALTDQHVMQSTPVGDFGDFLFDTALLSCLPDFSKPFMEPHRVNTPLFVESPDRACMPPVVSVPSISPNASPTNSISNTFPASRPTPGSQLGSPIAHSPSVIFPQFSDPLDSNPLPRPPYFSLSTGLLPRSSTSSFRPSKYEWAAASDWQGHGALQSPTFKNSHYNTAHYNNVNFQPEQWVPELEDTQIARKKGTS